MVTRGRDGNRLRHQWRFGLVQIVDTHQHHGIHRVHEGIPCVRVQQVKKTNSIGFGLPPVISGSSVFLIGKADHHTIPDTFTPIRSVATLFHEIGSFIGNPRRPLLRFLVSDESAVDYDDIHG
jgi:hypothetical protein